jgi:hypothetical protein
LPDRRKRRASTRRSGNHWIVEGLAPLAGAAYKDDASATALSKRPSQGRSVQSFNGLEPSACITGGFFRFEPSRLVVDFSDVEKSHAVEGVSRFFNSSPTAPGSKAASCRSTRQVSAARLLVSIALERPATAVSAASSARAAALTARLRR